MSDYSIYNHLKAHDIIELLRPLLDGGGYQCRLEDGKLVMKNPQLSKDTPWIHTRHKQGFNCGLWHQVIFNFVSMKQPEKERFVPRHCLECWKVVVKPYTLEQLFNLLELQRIMNRPSKCGIEPRDSVHGLYGGYFYNKGQSAGLECFDAVYEEISKHDILKPILDEVDSEGRTKRLVLKRGCTEYEHNVGPSNLWEIKEGQNFLEDLVETYLVVDEMNLSQPEHIAWNIKRRWIEWAWKNGDQTYLKYTGGEPLYPAYVVYHPPKGAQVVSQPNREGSENARPKAKSKKNKRTK